MSILNKMSKTTQAAGKRVGRGYGSGKGGHNSGRGTKGAGSRKSSSMPLWFEGGQLPLVKRLPMIRGKSRFNTLGKIAEVNLGDLAKVKAEQITLDSLKLAGLVEKNVKNAKVVATGKLDKAITVSGLRISAGAKKAIEAAGGKVA
ncbi:MAG: 50S ribosomal protein L15 [bacterium]|nr:50S ribosomal protein L15 [bacterium]